MMTTEQRDQAVLRYIGYNTRPRRDTAVVLGHGRASLGRLVKAGFVKTDPQFSGCLVLTEDGGRHLAFLDGAEDWNGEPLCKVCGSEAQYQCAACDRQLCEEHARTTSVPGDAFCLPRAPGDSRCPE